MRSGVFLRAIAVSPFALRSLSIAWLALLLTATQIPQRFAPLTTSDGLSRANLRFIEAVGLDRLGDSTILWLLVTLSVIVFVARRLFVPPSSGVSETDASSVPEQKAEHLARELEVWSKRHTMRRMVALSRRRDGGTERIELGPGRWGRWLLLLAGLGLVWTWVGSSMAVSPLLLEVRLAKSKSPNTASALVAEAGRLVSARSGFSATCHPKGETISCQLDLQGERGQVELTPNRSAQWGRWHVAWVGRAVDPKGVDARLHWQLTSKSTPDKAANSQHWYAFDVAANRTVDVPDLNARVTAVRRDAAGWMFFGQRGRDKSLQSFVMAAPALLPTGVGAARYNTSDQVRLLVTSALPRWSLIVWSALGLLAALLMTLLPWVEIEVDLTTGAVEVHACNRPALQRLVSGSSGDANDFAVTPTRGPQ